MSRAVDASRRLFTFMTLIWLVVGTASAAATVRQNLTFSLYISGIRVGAIELAGVMTDKAYNVRGSMGGAGIGRAFVPAKYSGSVSGFVRRGRFQPREFSARFDRGRKYFTVDISYRGDRPSLVDIFPVPAKRAYDLDYRKIRKTLDPLSTTFDLLRPKPRADVCNTSQEIYEGRRLSRIALGKPVVGEDGKISCAGTYTRVDGYPPSLMKKQTKFEFEIVFSEIAGGQFQAESFTADTTFGKARGVRK